MTRPQTSDENADTLLAAAAPAEQAPRAAAPLRVGERIERYTILDRLGAGGMGVVHAAYDPTLERKVALKLLHTASRDTAAQARARLKREARALAKLHHPNVVTVYEVGMVDGHVYLAMELVEGRSLNEWQKSPDARDWRHVVHIYLAAGRGLSAAHAAGLVHRDFKPANVLLGSDGRVVVTDFGLARLTSGTTPLPDAASVPSASAWGVDLQDLRTPDTRPVDPAAAPTLVPAAKAAPGATPGANADATLDANADATPDANTGATPSAAPDGTPDATIDATPDATIDATPDATRDATPDATIDADQTPAAGAGHPDDTVRHEPEPGIARKLHEARLDHVSLERLTRTGMVLGTPAYMAPEQHTGDPVDARTDQFSFCVSLYESLYGMRPFAGANPDDLCDAIRAGRIAAAPRGSAVPRRVRRVLLRGLSADPDERFPAMHQLLDALERAARPRVMRMLAIGGAVAFTLTAIALAVLAARPHAMAKDDPCTVGLTGAWDASVAAAVRTALAARPGGAEVFAQVAARLDAGKQAWEDARGRICAAGRPPAGLVDDPDDDPGDSPTTEQSSEPTSDESSGRESGQRSGLFHHRIGCLLDYRDQMASLTELLSAGDERAATFAVSAARSLPDPTRCVSLPAQSASFVLPRDPARRAEVARLRADLARAVTAYETASFERATEIADEVLTGARAIDDRYLEAAALFWRGQGRAMRYDRAGLFEDVAEAILIAEEQGYPDILARALVATAAMRVLDPTMERATMNELIRRAQATVDRLSDADELGGWISLIDGYHRARYGDTDGADAAFARARALYQQAGKSFKAARVNAYWGMSLYAQGRQRQAEERLAAGLAVLGQDLESMPYEIVCGLELIVRAADRLERYQEARRIHAFLDRKCPHHAPPRPDGPVRTIRGHVRDAAGQPVAGAVVFAHTGLLGNGRYTLQGAELDAVATAVTDAQGAFAIDRVSDEPVVLVAEAEAGRSFPVAASAGAITDMTAEIRAWGSVRGRIEGDGEDNGLGRERMVALLPATPEAPYRTVIEVPVRLDGSFAVERLAAGRYHLGLSEGQRDPKDLVAGRWLPAHVLDVTPGSTSEVVVAAPTRTAEPTAGLSVQVRNRFHGELPFAHVWVFPGRDVPASITDLHARWYDGVTPLHFAVTSRAQAAPAGTAPDDLWHRFTDLPGGDLVACAVPLGRGSTYAPLRGYPPDLDLYCQPVTAAEQRDQPLIIEVAPMKRRP
jgi:serine/threonine protein kinase